jgi:type I restriction enzyme S subunit
MNAVPHIPLGEIMAERLGSVDPSRHPQEIFDLYSIPAFDKGQPEVIAGGSIGSAKQIVRPGDVLLSRIVPHIRRAWVVGANSGRRIIASGEWIVFQSDRIDPRYLRHVLVGDPFHAQFMNTVSGVGGSLLRARPSHVAKIKIPLPPLQEQRRIAAILDQAADLRAKRRATLGHLDSLTSSLFLELFGDPANNPKGIKVVRLSEITTKITDGVHLRPTYTESGVPFISVKDITSGVLRFDDCKFISREDHQRFTKHWKPERNDILYTKVGATYGRSALIDTDQEFSIYVSVCLIKPNRDLVEPIFLNTAMSTRAIKSQADRRIKGIGVPDLHLDQIQNFLVPLPPLEEQRRFVAHILAQEQVRTAQRASLAGFDDLFDAIQYRAFRGEL